MTQCNKELLSNLQWLSFYEEQKDYPELPNCECDADDVLNTCELCLNRSAYLYIVKSAKDMIDKNEIHDDTVKAILIKHAFDTNPY